MSLAAQQSPEASTLPDAPSVAAQSQSASKPQSGTEFPDNSGPVPNPDPYGLLSRRSLLSNLAHDQKMIWKSPFELRPKDAVWAVPFAALTAGLIASDRELSKQVPSHTNQLQASRDLSNVAIASLLGTGGGLFLWGQFTHNDHARETGWLSGESVLNATIVDYALKTIAQRPRPTAAGGGDFFHGGSSFPSEHSAAAWAIASIVAHEYPGPLTKMFAYGLASAVTVSRVTSREHFPSDVLIGSTLGWWIGRQVYRAHHDPDLGGSDWGPADAFSSNTARQPENMGSPYVPLDSWVYSAFDRLAALGLVQTGFSGMRPWTRMECARLVEESNELLKQDGAEPSEPTRLQRALATEFADELDRIASGRNVGAQVESVYTRVTGIAGSPLRDGYHFGQTIINDNGRPYAEGTNIITGVSGRALAGPLAFYVRGEYQQAPSTPAYNAQALQAVAAADNIPVLSNAADAVRRFRLLDTYVAYNFRDTQISFGKQSLWLGPGDGGPFLFSDNAEPIWMLRINRVSPTKLPGPFRLMGPVRGEFFLGQLSGHHFVFSDPKLYGPDISPQPFIHGQKISFKPTPDLELGFAFSVVFGGPGAPFTFHNFLRTFTFSTGTPGGSADAGDRRGSFDLSYRLPFLRKWVTIYNDSLVDDEVSPIITSHRGMHPGVYLPRIPKIPKLDLRLEGVYTDVPGFNFTGFFYTNGRYRSGYTNDGNLLASWIGREGRGGQGWATYWLSPKSKIQLGYRNATVDKEFLRGGRIQDINLRTELMLRPDLGISGFLQYETWRFPLVAATPQTNFTGWVQLTFWPKWKK
jgi:hypothetical protein